MSALAVVALSAASIAVADAKTDASSSAMPHCTSTNYVVWYVQSSNTYYTKNNAMYGKGDGKYVCRSVAINAHAKMAHIKTSSSMGGSMGGSMGSAHGSMGNATSAPLQGQMHGSGGTMGGRASEPGNGIPTPAGH